MKKNKFGIAFLVLGIIFLSSCSPDLKKFNGKENKTVEVKKGELFSINLKEDHAGGQTWTLNSEYDGTVLEYKKSNYQGAENGTTDFIFESKQAGGTTLRLNLIEYSHKVDSVEVQITVSE